MKKRAKSETRVAKVLTMWRVIWKGTICTPLFNDRGAAQALLDMYHRGQRKPELPKQEPDDAE